MFLVSHFKITDYDENSTWFSVPTNKEKTKLQRLMKKSKHQIADLILRFQIGILKIGKNWNKKIFEPKEKKEKTLNLIHIRRIKINTNNWRTNEMNKLYSFHLCPANCYVIKTFHFKHAALSSSVN